MINEDMEILMKVIYNTIMAQREKYLRAWIAETGLLPSECELVEERHKDKIVIYMRKRKTEEEV